MGSVLLVTMTTTSHYLLLFLLSGGAQCLQTPWSSLSLLGQASKRSAGLEETVVESKDDLDLAASETHYDAVLYNDDNDKPESRGGPYRRRKFRTRRRKNRYDPLVIPSSDYPGTLAEDKLYDRDSSYQAPADSYNSPSSSYEAPSYNPPSYQAPSYQADYGGYSAGRKKREAEGNENSVETVFPFLDKISHIGWRNLKTVNCQKELLCEMAVMGDSEDANSVQRTISTMFKITPAFIAQQIGVNDVLDAREANKCQQFKCNH